MQEYIILKIQNIPIVLQ